VSALPTLPPLGTVDGAPSSDTSSPLYLPPTGYYQADNGSIVPMNTPSSTATVPSTGPGSLGAYGDAAIAALKAKASSVGIGLEDWIFIALGFVVIIAGIFGFDKTRTIITTAGKTATKAASLAA
jgi:hypothetical protein